MKKVNSEIDTGLVFLSGGSALNRLTHVTHPYRKDTDEAVPRFRRQFDMHGNNLVIGRLKLKKFAIFLRRRAARIARLS